MIRKYESEDGSTAWVEDDDVWVSTSDENGKDIVVLFPITDMIEMLRMEGKLTP